MAAHHSSGLVVLTMVIPSFIAMGTLFYNFVLFKLKRLPENTPVPKLLGVCAMMLWGAQPIAAVSERLTFSHPDSFPIVFLLLTAINVTIVILLERVAALKPRVALATLYLAVLGGAFYIQHLSESGSS